MRAFALLPFLLLLLLAACGPEERVSSTSPEKWVVHNVQGTVPDSMTSGTTYLSIYSQIFSQNEHRTYELTATVSLRNVSRSDTIYITSAEYLDTAGDMIRSYFERPIFLLPLETVTIVIDDADKTGGSGANFLFDWQAPAATDEPIFEAVMISTSGQQGISFTTQGVKLK